MALGHPGPELILYIVESLSQLLPRWPLGKAFTFPGVKRGLGFWEQSAGLPRGPAALTGPRAGNGVGEKTVDHRAAPAEGQSAGSLVLLV